MSGKPDPSSVQNVLVYVSGSTNSLRAITKPNYHNGEVTLPLPACRKGTSRNVMNVDYLGHPVGMLGNGTGETGGTTFLKNPSGPCGDCSFFISLPKGQDAPLLHGVSSGNLVATVTLDPNYTPLPVATSTAVTFDGSSVVLIPGPRTSSRCDSVNSEAAESCCSSLSSYSQLDTAISMASCQPENVCILPRTHTDVVTSDLNRGNWIQNVGARNRGQVGNSGAVTLTTTVLAGSLSATAPPKSETLVPFGWKRLLLNGVIVFVSPSNIYLRSMEQVQEYLQTQGTCKCGLECPLKVDNIFNFDPKIPSKPWVMEEAPPNDLTKFCNHKRKIVAMSALQNSAALVNSSANNNTNGKCHLYDQMSSGSNNFIANTMVSSQQRASVSSKEFIRAKNAHQVKLEQLRKEIPSTNIQGCWNNSSVDNKVVLLTPAPGERGAEPPSVMCNIHSDLGYACNSFHKEVGLPSTTSDSAMGLSHTLLPRAVSNETKIRSMFDLPCKKAAVSLPGNQCRPNNTMDGNMVACNWQQPQTVMSGIPWEEMMRRKKTHVRLRKSKYSLLGTDSPCPNVDVRQIPPEQNRPPVGGFVSGAAPHFHDDLTGFLNHQTALVNNTLSQQQNENITPQLSNGIETPTIIPLPSNIILSKGSNRLTITSVANSIGNVCSRNPSQLPSVCSQSTSNLSSTYVPNSHLDNNQTPPATIEFRHSNLCQPQPQHAFGPGTNDFCQQRHWGSCAPFVSSSIRMPVMAVSSSPISSPKVMVRNCTSSDEFTGTLQENSTLIHPYAVRSGDIKETQTVIALGSTNSSIITMASGQTVMSNTVTSVQAGKGSVGGCHRPMLIATSATTVPITSLGPQSRSPLELVQNVVSSIQCQVSPTLTHPSSHQFTSAQTGSVISSRSPTVAMNQVLKSPNSLNTGPLLMANRSQFIMTNHNNSLVMPQNVTLPGGGVAKLSAANAIPMASNVVQLLNMQAGPVLLQSGSTILPHTLTLDAGLSPTLPTLQLPLLSSPLLDCHPSDTQMSEPKKKGKKRKTVPSTSQIVTPLHLQTSPVIMSHDMPRVHTASVSNLTGHGPMMQTVAFVPGNKTQLLMNSMGHHFNSLTTDLSPQHLLATPTQTGNLMQPVNLLGGGNIPLQQFIHNGTTLVVPSIQGMVVNQLPDGTLVGSADTSNTNTISVQLQVQNIHGQNVLSSIPTQNVFTSLSGGQNILTNAGGMILRTPGCVPNCAQIFNGKVTNQVISQNINLANNLIPNNGSQLVMSSGGFENQVPPTVNIHPHSISPYGNGPRNEIHGELMGQSVVVPNQGPNATLVQRNTTIVHQQQTTMLANSPVVQNYVEEQQTINPSYFFPRDTSLQQPAVPILQSNPLLKHSVSTQTAVNHGLQVSCSPSSFIDPCKTFPHSVMVNGLTSHQMHDIQPVSENTANGTLVINNLYEHQPTVFQTRCPTNNIRSPLHREVFPKLQIKQELSALKPYNNISIQCPNPSQVQMTLPLAYPVPRSDNNTSATVCCETQPIVTNSTNVSTGNTNDLSANVKCESVVTKQTSDNCKQSETLSIESVSPSFQTKLSVEASFVEQDYSLPTSENTFGDCENNNNVSCDLQESKGKGLKRKHGDAIVVEGGNTACGDEDDADSPPPPREPRSFTVGDLVWGQIRGFPSWPGKLVKVEDVKGNSQSKAEATDYDENMLWVRWFGDHTFTRVEKDKLKTLTEGLEAHHHARKKYRRGRKMNLNLENAIQEAMMELDRKQECKATIRFTAENASQKKQIW